MKKLLFFIVLLLIMSGCAYQRYHAQNFKPDKSNKVRDCSVYDNANTMKEHYNKRNR